MQIKKKQIQVSSENLKKICKAFNTPRVSVYNALGYRSNSDRAVMIRKQAIELYGGIETTKIIMN